MEKYNFDIGLLGIPKPLTEKKRGETSRQSYENLRNLCKLGPRSESKYVKLAQVYHLSSNAKHTWIYSSLPEFIQPHLSYGQFTQSLKMFYVGSGN